MSTPQTFDTEQRKARAARPKRKYRHIKGELGGQRGEREIIYPIIDEHLAAQVAKILNAGLSQEQTVHYIVPGLRPAAARQLAETYMNHPLIFAAVNALNQGEWPELPKDKRLSIALDKHQSEAAYYMLTHAIEGADKEVMGKLTYCRDVLEKSLQGGIDPSDPLAAFARMARDVMEAAVAKQAGGTRPVQLQSDLDGIIN